MSVTCSVTFTVNGRSRADRLSDDPSFSTLTVGWWTPGANGPTPVATVPRTSTNDLYSARAFASNGTVYLAGQVGEGPDVAAQTSPTIRSSK